MPWTIAQAGRQKNDVVFPWSGPARARVVPRARTALEALLTGGLSAPASGACSTNLSKRPRYLAKGQEFRSLPEPATRVAGPLHRLVPMQTFNEECACRPNRFDG